MTKQESPTNWGEVVPQQLAFIRSKISEARSPLEKMSAYALYLRMIGVDLLVFTSSLFNVFEKHDSEDKHSNRQDTAK